MSYSSVDYSSLTISRMGRLSNLSQAIKDNQAQQAILFKELHQTDRARILSIFNASGIPQFSSEEIAKHLDLNERVQTELQIMQEELAKTASSENRAKNLLPRVPPAVLAHALSFFLPRNENAALEIGCVGHSSLAASRFQRLEALSQAIEQDKTEVAVLFQELHKDDRARILQKFKVKTFNWMAMKTFKEPLLKELEAMKAERSFTIPSRKSQINHMRTLPPIIMTHSLGGFLLPRAMTHLRTTYKTAFMIPSTAPSIIRTYHLEPLIETYLHLSCKNLSGKEQEQALEQLMSMAFDLSKLEELSQPSYHSLAPFFELIEARNLLRIAPKFIRTTNRELPKDLQSTLQKAEKIREILRRNQTRISTFRKLDLSYHNLTLLPPEIGQLKGLKTLLLGDNRLVSLTKEIGQLQDLETLASAHNRLVRLPREIGQLQRLTLLSLHNNHLTDLPQEIYQLGHLEKLFLDSNYLTSLSAEIGQLKALTKLQVGDNRLVSLPKEIGYLKALKYLALHHNHLTTLPKEIGQLDALVSLSLTGNSLLSIPEEMEQLRALTSLYLYQNHLASIPVGIGQLKLDVFEARKNELIDLPIGLERFREQLEQQNNTI